MYPRKSIQTGTIWETNVGYSRAVRVGSLIEVAGTTAMDGQDIQCQGDVYGQTKFVIQKMAKALKDLGSDLHHVVRTRVYLKHMSDWEEAGRAHGEFFSEIKPASTMLAVNALIHPELLVEVEMTAMIPDADI
jgi:enamine deaminase RidA (YjgF/YER057c/UK114 family)